MSTEYVSKKEAALIIGVSVTTVQHYIKVGYIKPKKAFEGYLIKRTDAERMRDNRPKPKGRPRIYEPRKRIEKAETS